MRAFNGLRESPPQARLERVSRLTRRGSTPTLAARGIARRGKGLPRVWPE